MIEFDVVITNGYVDIETLSAKREKSWTFVTTLPAHIIHPHAMPTDMATIFSRYKETKPQEGGEAVCMK